MKGGPLKYLKSELTVEMLVSLNINTEEKIMVVKSALKTKGKMAGFVFSFAHKPQLYSISEIVL
ncbi:hypothetical protein AAY42_04260 [Flagellimonas eckloniae]|uniref:Uncharacterized protein n=1 Tax=Flagellimonas eckloniae TaxID=346185 RepID=A0A0Q0XK10_9FLAO|nr:hypothetical protein AAY42_04260 [Allomuricauda eckloniae]